jgi:hypothetical protein
LAQAAGSLGILSLGAVQANGTRQVIYTAPASISASVIDPVTYSVNDEHDDAIALGSANVLLNAGPNITSQAPSAVEKGQTTVIGIVTRGLPGDTLTLKETAGAGSLSLGAVQANGTQQVIYTAPAGIAASAVDAVAYTVSDEHADTFASGSANVQLDAGPSVKLLPFVTSGANKGTTIATSTPGLPTDTLSLVIIKAPQSGSALLQGGSVEFTPGNGSPSAPVSFSFELKDQLGGVTPVGTVIIATGLINNINGSASGDTDISLGNGLLNKVTLAGSGNVVDAGFGADSVTGGVSNNTVILGAGLDNVTLSGGNNTVTLGDGLDSVKLGGGGNVVTLGNGADSLSVGGSGNQIKLGSGIEVVHGGTGDTIDLANTTLSLYGTNEMVFLGTGNATVNDFSIGLDMKIGPTAGTDVLAHFASDLSGVVDLIGGIGGFKTAAAAVSALKSDGHGGALLSFGHNSSLDFTSVAPSQLHAANFQIG